MPWAHTTINPDGKLLPCSEISRDFSTQHINTVKDFDQDWWNGKPMQQLRQDLAQGIKTKHCDSCWKNEAVGKSSLRQEFNKRLAKHTKLRNIAKSNTYIAEDLPIALDLNLSNICNFKCMMCGPTFSNQLQAERKQHHLKFKELTFLPIESEFNFDWPNQDQFRTLLKTVTPKIKILELRGGEPLLIENVKLAISSVEDKKNSIVNIHTNGSVEFDYDFVAQLTQFQHIWLFVSVDGIEEHGEYVRYGSQWSMVDSTISKLSKLSNCTFRICTVLQFYSALTFPRIADYVIDRNLDMDIRFCYEPNFLSIHSMLPKHHGEFLQFINKKTQQYPHIPWLKTVQGYLNSYVFDPVAHEQCKKYTALLDSIRHNEFAGIQELFHDA